MNKQEYSDMLDNLNVTEHPMSTGIQVEHIPTGNIVVCMQHQSKYKNKDTAIMVMEMMLDER